MAWIFWNSKYSISNYFIYSTLFYLFSLACTGRAADAAFKEGNEYYDEKKYKEAIDLYNESIQKNKYFAGAYIKKGMALEFLGEYRDAITTYNALLKVNIFANEATLRRGICFLKQGANSCAIKDLQLAYRKEPDNPETLTYLGFCKIKLNDTSGLQELNRAVLLDSQNYVVFYNRAISLYLLRRFLDALCDFNKASDLNSDFGEAYFGAGLCIDKLNGRVEACRLWKIAADKGYVKARAFFDLNCKLIKG
ncbi:MAG: tetratricopeptide repeat protein [Bacteroidota bacterium]|nr:tetratricopeptide repeat protein [Bacteroidota bacterium]